MESKGMKVLVIDDELQMRKLLEMALTSYAYTAILASTGQEGLMLAVTTHPDLVIVDLGLPDMDGKDVVTRLREWSSVLLLC